MINIEWTDIIKKEARGITDRDDLGKVQKVFENHILTVKGMLKKTYFSISKELIDCYDGHILRFKVTEKEKDDKTDAMTNKPSTVKECHYPSSSWTFCQSQDSERTADQVTVKDLADIKTITGNASPIFKEPIIDIQIAEENIVYKKTTIKALQCKDTVKSLPFRAIHTPLPSLVSSNTIIEEISQIDLEVTIPLKPITPPIAENSSIVEEFLVKEKPITKIQSLKEEILRDVANLKI